MKQNNNDNIAQRWLFRLGCQTRANEGRREGEEGRRARGKVKTQETITIKIVFFVRSRWAPIRISGCRLRVRAQAQAQPPQSVKEEEERWDVSADVRLG